VLLFSAMVTKPTPCARPAVKADGRSKGVFGGTSRTCAALAQRAATAVSKAASLLRLRSTCRSRAVMTFKRRKYSPATGSIKLPMNLSLCSSGSYQKFVRRCGGNVGKKVRPFD
jgi:hypothetical protein